MRTARYTAIAAILVLASMSAAATAPRSLVPQVDQVLTAAFAQMKPALVLTAARLEHDHVAVTLCAADAQCFDVRLDEPQLGCDRGEVMGAFCVRVPPDTPPEARATIRRPLLATAGAALWFEGGPPPEPRPDESRPVAERTTIPGSPARMVTNVFLALVVPPLAGALLGVALRARAPRFAGRRLLPVLAFGVPIALVLLLGPRQRAVGVWDALLTAILASSACVLTARRAFAERGVAVLFAASIAASALLGEAAVRFALPPPPAFPPASAARLFFDAPAGMLRSPGGNEVVCNIFYGAGWSTGEHDDPVLTPQTWVPPPDRRRRVLFIGDSMVFGVGVQADQAFPALLERADPGAVHVNAGIPAIGPDGYLLLLRGWLERLTPDLVVLSLFAGNDLSDIDAPYPCCAGGPLLRYDGPTPLPRCRMPSGIESTLALDRYRRESAPPYLLRVLTGVSSAASYATAAFAGWSNAPVVDEPRRYLAHEHLAAILTAARTELAARGVPLVVLVLPMRPALESASQPDPPAMDRSWRRAGAEMHEIAEAAGIPVLDAWDLLADAVRDEGSARVFVDGVHLSVAGHAILADWLRRQLPAAEAAARAGIAAR